MTKDQMLKRIGQSAKICAESTEMAAKSITLMGNEGGKALGIALLAVGTGIEDALNNIAIILCEMLPKEE